MRYLALHRACFFFRPASRLCDFFHPRLRIALISHFVHSFHKFHIGYQPDPKTCDWRDICPRSAQRLTYSHTSNQTYATKHVCAPLYCSVKFPKNSTARTHSAKLSARTGFTLSLSVHAFVFPLAQLLSLLRGEDALHLFQRLRLGKRSLLAKRPQTLVRFGNRLVVPLRRG